MVAQGGEGAEGSWSPGDAHVLHRAARSSRRRRKTLLRTCATAEWRRAVSRTSPMSYACVANTSSRSVPCLFVCVFLVVTVQLASPRGALARIPRSPAEPRCAGPSEAGCTAADAFQRCVVAFGAVARAPGWEGQGRPSPLPTFGAVFVLSLLLSVL